MQFRAQSSQTGCRCELAACWRELLFWLLLLPATGALGSSRPRRQVAGLIEAGAFLLVAVSSQGRLKGLGLEFANWNRVGVRAAVLCGLAGVAAGEVIVGLAGIS